MQKQKPLEERHAALTNQIAKITSSEIKQIDVALESLKQQLREASAGEKSPGNGYHSAIEKSADTIKWVQIDLGKALPIDEVRLVPARPVDFPDTPGFGFPRRFRIEASNEPDFGSARTISNQTGEDFKNGGDKEISFPGEGKPARFIRVTATRLCTSDFVFALAELQVIVGGTNAAFGASVSALDSIEAGLWAKKLLVDGFDSRRRLGNTDSEAKKKLDQEIRALAEKRKGFVEALTDEATRKELAGLADRLREIDQEIAALPAPSKVYAAASDFKPESNFLPAKGPRPVYVLAKGDVKRARQLAEPGTVAAVPGAKFGLSDPSNEGARRAALAKWITDPGNMVTRRSLVNRVWHYHFGRGIVETPNDFGHMGAPPTHPELLDWLAFWFLENGESIKQLHRLIVTSATYRQSSSSKPEFARLDGDNRYLWRMNRARLDAESIHDAMLLISGQLDLTMGGPAIQQFFFKDDHSPVYDYTQFDADSPAARRRGIYRFVVRSVPDPLMDALDCPNASILSPKRNVTTTSLQALAVLNDPFVLKQCQHFAGRVANAGDLKKQIEQAYQLALNRRPTAVELKRLVPFAQKHGMANVCRVIFNSNEFMFVD
jgi:hypothetical protein